MHTYWQHIWTGRCHRALPGEEWKCSLWEEITKTEYEDWVLMRQMMWMWTPEQIQELAELDGEIESADLSPADVF